MINRFKYLLLIFSIILTPLQFSITAFANKDNIANEKKLISFKDFKKEFILTNSLESYIKSLKRLGENYNVYLNDESLDNINKELNDNTKDKIQILMKSLIKNVNLKVNFKNNEYYGVLKEITLLAQEINVAAYLEILLVKEEKLVGSKPISYLMNNSYFFYLINHVRYEVLTKTLFLSTKSKKQIL